MNNIPLATAQDLQSVFVIPLEALQRGGKILGAAPIRQVNFREARRGWRCWLPLWVPRFVVSRRRRTACSRGNDGAGACGVSRNQKKCRRFPAATTPDFGT